MIATTMKRSSQSAATPTTVNPWCNPKATTSLRLAEPADLAMILAGLQTMRNGDFSVRLPSAWVGLSARSRYVNEIVAANQQMAQELKRVG